MLRGNGTQSGSSGQSDRSNEEGGNREKRVGEGHKDYSIPCNGAGLPRGTVRPRADYEFGAPILILNCNHLLAATSTPTR